MWLDSSLHLSHSVRLIEGFVQIILLAGGFPISHLSTLELRAPCWLVPAHVELDPALLIFVRTPHHIVCFLAHISGFLCFKANLFSKQKWNPIDKTIKGQTDLIVIM